MYSQEAERNQPSVQSSDVGKMKRDFELLLVANKAYEKRCEENEVEHNCNFKCLQ